MTPKELQTRLEIECASRVMQAELRKALIQSIDSKVPQTEDGVKLLTEACQRVLDRWPQPQPSIVGIEFPDKERREMTLYVEFPAPYTFTVQIEGNEDGRNNSDATPGTQQSA